MMHVFRCSGLERNRCFGRPSSLEDFPQLLTPKSVFVFQLSLGLSRLFVVLTHCRCCVMAVLGCDAVCASLCFSTISRRSRGIFTLATATGQLRSGDCRFLSLATAIGHQRILPFLGPTISLPKICHSAGIVTFVVFWRLVLRNLNCSRTLL